MADTVTILGKTLPKNYVLVGGAAVAGIAIYAYTTGRGGGGEELEEVGLVDEFGDERITPTTVDTYDVRVDNRSGFKSDSEWFETAIDSLTSNYGVSSVAVASDALNKYLDNKPLNSTQVPMIQYVVNLLGPPPSGNRTIKTETTPVVPPAQNGRAKPGPITGLIVEGSNAQDITFRWNKATNAAKYKVRAIAGSNTTLATTVIPSTPTRFRFRSIVKTPLQRNKPYRIEVWGMNAAGELGPMASQVGRTQ